MSDTSIKKAYEKLESLCSTFESEVADLKADLKGDITEVLLGLPEATPAELKALEGLAKKAAKGKFTDTKREAETMLGVIEVIEDDND